MPVPALRSIEQLEDSGFKLSPGHIYRVCEVADPDRLVSSIVNQVNANRLDVDEGKNRRDLLWIVMGAPSSHDVLV